MKYLIPVSLFVLGAVLLSFPMLIFTLTVRTGPMLPTFLSILTIFTPMVVGIAMVVSGIYFAFRAYSEK